MTIGPFIEFIRKLLHTGKRLDLYIRIGGGRINVIKKIEDVHLK